MSVFEDFYKSRCEQTTAVLPDFALFFSLSTNANNNLVSKQSAFCLTALANLKSKEVTIKYKISDKIHTFIFKTIFIWGCSFIWICTMCLVGNMRFLRKKVRKFPMYLNYNLNLISEENVLSEVVSDYFIHSNSCFTNGGTLCDWPMACERVQKTFAVPIGHSTSARMALFTYLCSNYLNC